VDPLERVKKLRKEYEQALNAAESRRVAYHEAVLELIDRGGPHLRERAEELGLLDHPAQQTVTKKSPRRRNAARAVGVVGGLLVLVVLTIGALRVAQAPPFVPYVRVPRVLEMPEAAATRRVRDAGLNTRIIILRRSIPRSLAHHVLGVSSAAGERLAKGSTVTLYVVVPRTG
jgi:hypothetical protein